MKKLFVLLGVFCALCFVACSNFQLAGGDMGVVSLSIGDNLAREIRSAAASRNVADGTYTLTASIRGEYSDSQTVAVANGNYSGVTFTFEDVPVGKNIILDLTAKTGNNYIWYGNSGKHTVEQGENLLTIALGRVSGVLLWKDSSVKIAPYGNWDAVGTVLGDVPFWCFDDRRNLYVIGGNGVSTYELLNDGTYSSTPSNFYGSGFSYLSYDSVSRTLYGMSTSQISKLTENNTSDPIIDSLSNHDINNPEGFAVHNGIAYVANQGNGDDNGISIITIASFNLATKSLTGRSEFKLPTVFGSRLAYQMIYQEGALYLLLSCVEDSAPNISSVGAVAKIDPTTLRLDASFGRDGYLGLSTERKVPYQDWSGENQLCSVYAASSPTEQVFSRPLSFVAIMPKKLVIADAGCIVYDEIASPGDYPRLRGAVVSRIVTVDLETQSLGFENLNPEQYYWTGNPLGSSVDISSDTSSSSF